MYSYVRTVKTTSARQRSRSSIRHTGSGDIEHIGFAYDDMEFKLLKAAAHQRMADGQGELDLGLEVTERPGGGPTASRCR